MKKKEVKILAQESYINNVLDEKKVAKIAALLDRKTLKQYIRIVKLLELQKQVILVLPNTNVYNKSEKLLKGLFKEKKLVVKEDPSLLLGIQIQDNDIVYDFNLKNRLNTLQKETQEKYE